ncbi:Phosphoenolpyruvate synthase regulatory protein [hydrothermal vent metagenome]|uniref:Phosphoenolpyruvate synthase regulatory protein n=1 Tax=hydrothermal vent metagenome TaxID=652676 RepID=A0A3B0VKY1_9ZZZZ
MKKYTIFYVSDGTAITAETVGHSLISQFRDIKFKQIRIPFVDTVAKAQVAAEKIKSFNLFSQPLVINTVVDIKLRRIIHSGGGLKLDPFNRLLRKIEKNIGLKRSPIVGRAHGVVDSRAYTARMDATNFALLHDDGMSPSYDEADIILLGVSRSGKTPTCLYLALQYGVKAANYPLTKEDLDRLKIPDNILQHKNKVYGLTIDPFRLSQVRAERKPASQYANIRNCRNEVTDAESMFLQAGIEFLSTTHTSIEEISGKVLLALNLNNRLH